MSRPSTHGKQGGLGPIKKPEPQVTSVVKISTDNFPPETNKKLCLVLPRSYLHNLIIVTFLL